MSINRRNWLFGLVGALFGLFGVKKQARGAIPKATTYTYMGDPPEHITDGSVTTYVYDRNGELLRIIRGKG